MSYESGNYESGSYESGFDQAQNETERLAFLLSCYDVWSASRPGCGADDAGDLREEGE